MFSTFRRGKSKVLGVELTETHVSVALVEHVKQERTLHEIAVFSLSERMALGLQRQIQRLVKQADQIAVSIPFEQVNCHHVNVPCYSSDEQTLLFFEEYLEKLGHQPLHDYYFDFTSVLADMTHVAPLINNTIPYLLCNAHRRDVEAQLEVFAREAISPTILSVEPYALMAGVCALLGDEHRFKDTALCVVQITVERVTFTVFELGASLFARRAALSPLSQVNPSVETSSKDHKHTDSAIYQVEHFIRDYQLSTGGRCDTLIVLYDKPRSDLEQRLAVHLDVEVVVAEHGQHSSFKLASHIDRYALNQSCSSHILALGLALGKHSL